MRAVWTLFVLITIVTVLHASKAIQTSGVSGKVSPADAVDMIWAVQGKDSLKTIPANGAFMIEAKVGMYKIIIDAKQPYKDIMLESVEVTEGKTTDLGEIKIIQ